MPLNRLAKSLQPDLYKASSFSSLSSPIHLSRSISKKYDRNLLNRGKPQVSHFSWGLGGEYFSSQVSVFISLPAALSLWRAIACKHWVYFQKMRRKACEQIYSLVNPLFLAHLAWLMNSNSVFDSVWNRFESINEFGIIIQHRIPIEPWFFSWSESFFWYRSFTLRSQHPFQVCIRHCDHHADWMNS